MANAVRLRCENPLLYVDPLARDDLAAFELAVQYAKSRPVPLRIVSAVDDAARSLPGPGESAKRLHEEMVTSAQDKIDLLAVRATVESVSAEAELLRGPPLLGIIRAVVQANHDIVFQTMNGALEKANTPIGFAAGSGARGFSFGNTGESMMDNIARSFLVVKPKDLVSPVA